MEPLAPLQIADGLTLDPIDPMSNEQVAHIARLHHGYMREELDRTGKMAAGFPMALWLVTMFIRCHGQIAGYIAADVKRRSIEMVYVDKPFRGRHLGTTAVTVLSQLCPEPMALKAPLTPAGQALADRLGLRTAENTPDQIATAERDLDDLHKTIQKKCQHKRTGDPRKPCKRCYRQVLLSYTTEMVMAHTHDIRLVMRTKGEAPNVIPRPSHTRDTHLETR